jgi:hypothetical protein
MTIFLTFAKWVLTVFAVIILLTGGLSSDADPIHRVFCFALLLSWAAFVSIRRKRA